MGAMPYGVVLLPQRRTHEELVALAAAIAGTRPIHRLGETAPAHVSVAHFEAGPAQAARIAARVAGRPQQGLSAKIIGLLYAVVARGDYYVPQGGVYFGLEVVRRPDLSALHEETLGWIRDAGATPLGAVAADYRPHITLGITGGQPALPGLEDVPAGDLGLTLAFGRLGPYGTFPGLVPPG
jgi:hypothetical protein